MQEIFGLPCRWRWFLNNPIAYAVRFIAYV